MNKTSIQLGGGLAVVALSLVLASPRLRAQLPGSQGKGGSGQAHLGDNVTLIVPEGAMTAISQDLVVTGPAKAPKSVGTCTAKGSVVNDPGLGGQPNEVAFYDANVVDRTVVDGVWREAAAPKAKTEVGIAFRGFEGFKELQTGWHLGSWRDGGKCGPGYDVYVGHIIAGAPGAVNRGFDK